VSGVRAGDVIAGKFQIERVLGEGGMGYVVAARHMQLGQMVALKFMREDVCTPEYKSRFLREARNTVRLKSKHVSRVLDV
jgi:serine/threonine-protein kinase